MKSYMKLNRSIAFLNSIDDVWERQIPEEVTDRAKRSLLDYLAVTNAGAAFQKEKTEKYLAFAQPEAGRFRAIGMGRDLALKEAVFLNGLNAHALDYDDGTNSGIIHLGSPIYSLLLPLAQRYGASINEVLRAAILGYEASQTLATSIQPGHKALGYHATGTCGTIGATLAASYLLGFTEKERFQAFGAACVAASGTLKVLDGESELKPYNVAKTALLALTALQMGKAGFQGHEDPLGGRGFLKMMTGREDIELRPVLEDGTYAICKAYVKPYASCRYTHPSVEAAIRMRSEAAPEEIREILVRTYDLAVFGHDHVKITGSYGAKMSIPYATAAGLTWGKAGLREFEEKALGNATVRALTEKVRVVADEELSRDFPKKQGAIVEIMMKSGDKKCCRVDFPKGEPENPLTSEEFRERYDALMEYGGTGPEKSAGVYEMVLEGRGIVDELVKMP